MKPWTRLECVRLVSEAGIHLQDVGPQTEAGRLYDSLHSEFSSELSLLGVTLALIRKSALVSRNPNDLNLNGRIWNKTNCSGLLRRRRLNPALQLQIDRHGVLYFEQPVARIL